MSVNKIKSGDLLYNTFTGHLIIILFEINYNKFNCLFVNGLSIKITSIYISDEMNHWKLIDAV